VQIVSGDHHNCADVGSALARRSIDTEGTDAVVDLPNSAVALAVGDVVRNVNRTMLVTAAVTTRLTGDACSPNAVHYSLDNCSMANVPSRELVRDGGATWFYVTADYAFGRRGRPGRGPGARLGAAPPGRDRLLLRAAAGAGLARASGRARQLAG
jgi:branched-chain amino acid transport system substrate-binding protein